MNVGVIGYGMVGTTITKAFRGTRPLGVCL